MSKNLSFENTLKEDKNEEFLAFVKDYNSTKAKQTNYEFAKGSLLGSLLLLLVVEGLGYYQTEDGVLKGMITFGSLFMFAAFMGKTTLEVLNGIINKKQRKKDLYLANEKAQDWIVFFKDKENKLSLARSLIVKLENIEKIKLENTNTEHIEKSIQSKKEDVYNLVKYEINKNEFDKIERLLTVMHNLETNVSWLFNREQEYKQIKNEIHGGISSNSFKDNKANKSFN